MCALGRQNFPGNNKALVEVYKGATSCKYGYLVINSTANGNDAYKLKTRIFLGEDPLVYILINYKKD